MADTNSINPVASLAAMDSAGRAKAADGTLRNDRLKAATDQFEALFIGYLLKVMRSTVEPADPASSMGKDIYLELFDNELALNIAQTRGLGIGEMIYRQLSQETNADIPVAPAAPSAPAPPPSAPAPAAPEKNETPQETSGSAAFSYPVNGRLTSKFGLRPDPFTGRTRLHRGVDIAAPEGTPFHAATSGTVVFAGLLADYGNTVIVEDAAGNRTLYGHASRVLVRAGDPVEARQQLGLVGRTGRSTGPHLHFEAQIGGKPIDPERLIGPALSSRNLEISVKYGAPLNDKQGNQEWGGVHDGN